jgi:hypothetical protein
MDRDTIRKGLTIAGISALVALISSLLALYTQLSDVVGTVVAAKLKKDFAPIGTIVSSVLNPVSFAEAIGEIEGAGVRERKWVLADGRDVTDSQYARTTHKGSIPDLRGLFLRGVDSQESRLPGQIEDYATARPKVPFTGIAKEAGGELKFNQFLYGADNYNVPGGSVQRPYPNPIDFKWNHAHQVEIDGGGDAETRPRNAAVYYYVKIN